MGNFLHQWMENVELSCSDVKNTVFAKLQAISLQAEELCSSLKTDAAHFLAIDKSIDEKVKSVTSEYAILTGDGTYHLQY